MEQKNRNGFTKFMILSYGACVVAAMFFCLAKYFGWGLEEASYITCLAPMWVPFSIFISGFGLLVIIVALKEWNKW